MVLERARCSSQHRHIWGSTVQTSWPLLSPFVTCCDLACASLLAAQSPTWPCFLTTCPRVFPGPQVLKLQRSLPFVHLASRPQCVRATVSALQTLPGVARPPLWSAYYPSGPDKKAEVSSLRSLVQQMVDVGAVSLFAWPQSLCCL